MSSATSEKLNQLRTQLQDCTNPKVAQVLKSAIAKLEAQLNPGQVQAKTPKAKPSKIAERKSALKKSQREANRIASRQQRTTLKPPSLSKVEPKPEATSQNGMVTAPTQDKPQELSDAMTQSDESTTQDRPKPQTDPSLQHKNPAPANLAQVEEISLRRDQNPVTQDHTKSEANTNQQQADKTSKAKSQQRNRRKQRQPLLPGNGMHRAWCRVSGIIRVQEEVEDGKQKSIYFLEVDGYPVKLFLKRNSFKHLKPILDKPAMVFGYPNIMNGQITALQLTGASKQVSKKTENFVLIGVWRADKQRVLIQRDQKLDPEIHIHQHSPLVSEACLEKLEDGKLYEFTCQKDGITVTVVGVEAIADVEMQSTKETVIEQSSKSIDN